MIQDHPGLVEFQAYQDLPDQPVTRDLLDHKEVQVPLDPEEIKVQLAPRDRRETRAQSEQLDRPDLPARVVNLESTGSLERSATLDQLEMPDSRVNPVRPVTQDHQERAVLLGCQDHKALQVREVPTGLSVLKERLVQLVPAGLLVKLDHKVLRDNKVFKGSQAQLVLPAKQDLQVPQGTQDSVATLDRKVTWVRLAQLDRMVSLDLLGRLGTLERLAQPGPREISVHRVHQDHRARKVLEDKLAFKVRKD